VASESEELTEKIVAAAVTVHKQLGPGFLEAIYENALAHELRKQGLKVDQQLDVPVMYDGVEVGKHRLDMFVADRVVVELKTVADFSAVHFSVMRSQLRCVNHRHGVLLNFAKGRLDSKLVVIE
jgi:GxxExxY protein